jgi:hypothetical protein
MPIIPIVGAAQSNLARVLLLGVFARNVQGNPLPALDLREHLVEQFAAEDESARDVFPVKGGSAREFDNHGVNLSET